MHSSLLATKIQAPPRQLNLVPRPQLTSMLDQALTHPLTLISAPPGFGKTTLVTEWLTQARPPFAWVSLDEGDNDPARFLSYVCAALGQARRGLGEGVLNLVQSPQPPPLEALLTVLINEIESLSEVLVLILDDFQVIRSAQVHAGLRFLLEHLPASLHLVLVTRIDPPLSLNRLRGRGELLEVRAQDLRFTTAEASAFLTQRMKLSLASEQIAALEGRTEGWIAGLQLAALSMRGRDDLPSFVAAFAGSHHFVLDYLSDQVLAQQPPDLLDFLLQTCILHRMNAALCRALTERTDAQRVLQELEQRNLFVMALDQDRRWYRYHPLFADVLRNRLHTADLERVPELHRRASLHLAGEGDWVDAVEHALAARDLELVAQLIEKAGISIALGGQVRMLQRWLAQLPDAVVRSRPLLATSQALAFSLTDQLAECSSYVESAAHSLTDQSTPAEQVLVHSWGGIFRGELALNRGDLTECVEISRTVLETAPADSPMRLIAQVRVARAFALTGDVTSASERMLASTIAPLRASGNLYTLLNGITFLARLYALQRHLRQAEKTFAQVLEVMPHQSGTAPLVISPNYYFGLADLRREWNDLDAANQCLAQGMELTRGSLSVDGDVLAMGYLTLARVHRARGDFSSALATLDRFTELASARQFVPVLIDQARALRSQLLLANGELAAAAEWAAATGITLEIAPNFARESEYLTWARVQVAQSHATNDTQRLDKALLLLGRMLEDAQDKARLGSVIEILAVRALALEQRGDHHAARLALERALNIAESENYLRVFLDEGNPMRELLQAFGLPSTPASTSGRVSSYAARLLAAFETAREREPAHPDAAEPSAHRASARAFSLTKPLSERELQVLQLIAQGASNQEIANSLVVALPTVKRHISNIYDKLEVTSRTQALARARELRLL